MTWAFDQDIPAKPKMVLLALANRADRATGKCWPGLDLLSKEASVPERSLIRHIAALVHNGYVVREKARDASGRQKTNTYFLCLDRAPSEWGEWQWPTAPKRPDSEDGDDAAETPDETEVTGDEPGAVVAPGEAAENERLPTAKGGSSPTAIGGSQQPSSEPKSSNRESESGTRKVASGFSKSAQEAELERERLQGLAIRQGAKVFVLKGSRAWEAWCSWRGGRGMVASLPTTETIIEGKRCTGWWMQSLFPPSEPTTTTGPPTQPGTTMTPDDEAAMAEDWNK